MLPLPPFSRERERERCVCPLSRTYLRHLRGASEVERPARRLAFHVGVDDGDVVCLVHHNPPVLRPYLGGSSITQRGRVQRVLASPTWGNTPPPGTPPSPYHLPHERAEETQMAAHLAFKLVDHVAAHHRPAVRPATSSTNQPYNTTGLSNARGHTTSRKIYRKWRSHPLRWLPHTHAAPGGVACDEADKNQTGCQHFLYSVPLLAHWPAT